MHNLPIDPIERIAREYLEAKAAAPKRSSKERFADDVRNGYINARGKVTRLFCGTAEPEPEKADAILKEDWGPEGEKPW